MPDIKEQAAEGVNLHPECLPQSKLERPYNDWIMRALPAEPVWALCETGEEVDFFSQPSAPVVDQIVALTPQAAAHCYLAGVPYRKIEDFFDVRAFWHGDEAMLSLQGRWAEEVDAFLQDAYPPFRTADFRPASAAFFFLKILFDMLFRAAFGLAHLLVVSHPKRIYYFPRQTIGDTIDETFFFRDSVYKRLLPLFATPYRTGIEPLTLPEDARGTKILPRALQQKTFREQIISSLSPEWLNRLSRIKHFDYRDLLKPNKTANGPVLLYSNNSEVRMAAKAARARGFRLRTFDEVLPPERVQDRGPSELAAVLEKAWQSVCGKHFFREPLQWCGIDAFSSAESRLKYWWHACIPDLWKMFQQARTEFQRNPPHLAVTYSPWSLQHHALFQAARSCSIPTVTYQHGGFEGNCEYTTYDRTDLRQSDYRLVYGDGVASYLEERKAKSAGSFAEIIPVGSARLDALGIELKRKKYRHSVRKLLNVPDSEALVLYLPTSYQYNWYMAREAYLGVPYLELLIQVTHVLRECHPLHFVYKPFPEEPLDPVCRIIEKECPNCRVVTNIPVERLLQGCDAFVIDMPSTGLLEVLLTGKPALVFSDSRFVALRPEARELLRRCAMLSETPDDYIRNLRIFLGKGRFDETEDPDRDFLQAYGTYLDDGRSAQRAADVFRRIAEGGHRR